MWTSLNRLRYQGLQSGEYVWHNEDENAAYLLAGTLLGAHCIRIRFLRTAYLEGLRYQLVDGTKGTLPYHSWTVATGDEVWENTENESYARGLIEPHLQEFTFSDDCLRLTRPLSPKENFYGLGEHTNGMNKRGQAFPIWNYDPPKGHGPHTLQMYTSIPFYLSVQTDTGEASGIFIDHMGWSDLDLGKENPEQVQIIVRGNSLVVYFFTGPTPAYVLQHYTDLTGRMPLPPRWALGHHQARWSYGSEQEVRAVAARMRARNHACESVWLDIDHMDGYRTFTWKPEAFPDMNRLTADLGQEGFHIVPVIDPGIKVDPHYYVYQQGMEQDYFCRKQGGDYYTGSAWPGDCHFPDFSREEVRSWWGGLYQGFLKQGIAGSWNDMNEPSLTTMMQKGNQNISGQTFDEDVLHRGSNGQSTQSDGPATSHKFFHNAYGLQMARAMREGAQRLYPDQRPFVLTRSGTAGVQRYSAVWTGDNSSWWEHIPLAMVMCLNLSMSGVPFVGADIGGFWEECNGELLTRFAQLGAFLPFCRNHNANHEVSQEPWAFGEPYESAYRVAIEQRYRLLPYLYTLFHETMVTGAPIIRPLYYHFPQDEQVYLIEDAFLVGDSLLSAPVYHAGATSRRVYLPGTTWFGYWDGKHYEGGTWFEAEAPLERWPLFVRGNSILPRGPMMQYIDQQPTDPLTLECFMTADGQAEYVLYEDDGATLGYQRGAFAETVIHCHVAGDVVTVTLDERYHDYRPPRQWYDLVVHVNGRTLRQRVQAGQGQITATL